MVRLSIQEILDKINDGVPFEAVAEDYSFTLKVEAYVPYVCAAVHDGHQFRNELWPYCTHSAYERWYEEDPSTKEMVLNHPIVIAGLDSRFEYDLNRPPETAIYKDAWGKPLWKEELPAFMVDESLRKHENFYRVVKALIQKLEGLHNTCLVFDMHSYNWRRWDRVVPVWNLGTANVDGEKYANTIELWCSTLADMTLPNAIDVSAGINDTFQGNGYFLKFITQHFKNTLVLATEISKVYCDEEKQVIFPEVVRGVKEYLEKVIPQVAKVFHEYHGK